MSRAAPTIFTLLTLALTLPACGGGGGGGGKADAKSGGDAAAVAEAKKVWTTRCVTCHGTDGKGDGPGAKALDPKPRAFSDPAWEADEEKIKKVIVGGGAAVGLSPLMAPNPDLTGKPAVVDELVKIVKGLK